jgi:hypothetical protein
MQIPVRSKSIRAGEDRIYTTRSPAKGKDEQAKFRLVTMEEKGKLLAFATNTNISPKRIGKLFRKRWSIETSYRMARKFLAKTTSKIYSIRLLYFYLAILLYNLWVLLKTNYNSLKAPLYLAAVANGGILAFVIVHLVLTRSYLLDTIRAAIGKGKFVEEEKNEPMSYRMSYILLVISFIIFMAILLVLGAGATAIFVPIMVFVMFIFNSRLWGMTGVWAKGTSAYFPLLLGKYTFWQGAGPSPPTK